MISEETTVGPFPMVLKVTTTKRPHETPYPGAQRGDPNVVSEGRREGDDHYAYGFKNKRCIVS